MSKKFQNLTVDYSTLRTVSVGDRLAMINSSYGRSLLESLTPQQLADLFPSYYLKRLPDTGTGRSSPLSSRYGQLGEGGRTSADVVPGWQRRTQETIGGRTRSDPAAQARLTRDQKEVFDLLKKGEISANDPRVGFLKDLSEEDLKRAGIQKVNDSYSMTATAASQMSAEKVEESLKNSNAGGFSGRERATLDMIANREGSKDPNVIFGDSGSTGGTGKYSKMLGLDRRPLTDHSIAEVLELQKKLTSITRADGVARGIGTSAVGTGQMIRGTLLSNLRDLGIPESEWGNIKFDKNLQERLTLQNFKSSGIGDPNADPRSWNMRRLGQQYESLDASKGFRGLSETEIGSIANASSRRQSFNPTPEDIENERNRLIQQESQRREASLAQRLNPRGPSATRISRRGGNLEEDEGRDIYQGMGIRLTGGAAERGYASSLNRMNPELLGRYHNAIQQLPEELRSKLKITSAFRDPEDPRIQQMYDQWRAGPRNRPMADPRFSRHGMGSALDIQLGHLSEEERKAVTRAFKGSGLAAPVRREGFNDSHTHLELDQNFQGESAAARFNERMQQEVERRREARTQVNQTAVAAQPGAAAPVAPQTPPQPQASTQDAVTTGINQSAVEATPIPVRAKGGDVNVNADEIKAMPIGGLKGDNSVVVDENSNPLFTMNTKDESASYNPKTGDVSVKTKADSEGLMETNKLSNTVDVGSTIDREQPLQNQGFVAQGVQQNRNSPSSLNVVANLTEKFIKDPSFERAMAKTRFSNTGDSALGGHFDSGASNFS